MVSLVELWLPILLSGVLVFVASAILHMLLPYHRDDVKEMEVEDEVLGAIRRAGTPPAEYALPYATMSDMKSPEYVERRSAGVVAIVTVLPGGPPAMGKELAKWFVYCLVVSVFAGYVAGRALGPGTEYLEVFRFAGTVAFAGYALALWQETIWWGRPWKTTLTNTFDGLVYALLTAGTFGWLWPGGTM